jgi:hypothetical protein
MSTLQNKGQTAAQPIHTAKVTPSKPDPETVTISGYVVDESYGPGPAAPHHGVQTIDPANPNKPHARIGEAGQFPFTRGVHKTMYRSRLWTMRQFAGFGSADDTNKRFKRRSRTPAFPPRSICPHSWAATAMIR